MRCVDELVCGQAGDEIRTDLPRDRLATTFYALSHAADEGQRRQPRPGRSR